MNTYEKCCSIRRMLLNRTAEVMVYNNWSNDFATKQIREFPSDVKKMNEGEKLFNIQPLELTKSQMQELGFGKWSDETQMMLIPLWLFPFLAEKIETECIDGEKKLTTKSEMDTDNRFGCLAYGVLPSDV